MEEGQMAMMIPILGIVFGLGVAMVAIVTNHRAQVARLEFRHRERLAAIDKGLELPPEGVDPAVEAMHRRPRYLLRGLVWLFSGLAFGFFLLRESGPDEATLGLIPASVGLAYLIFWFVEGKREAAVLAASVAAPRE